MKLQLTPVCSTSQTASRRRHQALRHGYWRQRSKEAHKCTGESRAWNRGHRGRLAGRQSDRPGLYKETEAILKPGKLALVAEIVEEWVFPVDADLEAVGGCVFRRARSELFEAHFDHDSARKTLCA